MILYIEGKVVSRNCPIGLFLAFEAGSFVASSTRASIEPPLTDLFAIQWFVTLFSTSLPMSIVLRIWDAVLLEGSEVGIRAGLVVMDILSQ